MENAATDPSDAPRAEGRVVVAVVVAAFLALIGYFALGMPGMDHGGEAQHTEHDAEQ